MASATASASAPADLTTLDPVTSNQLPKPISSVEMKDLTSPPMDTPGTPPPSHARVEESTADTVAGAESTDATSSIRPISTLGPATEGAPTIASSSSSGALVLSITLMTSTGARHPYRIDEKYLANRNLLARTAAGTFEPRELKGYSLKELIWTDWRTEWEPRPASPDKIRLIIMGKLVDDKKALKEYPFAFDSPNVVQISVKPSDLDEENEAAHAKSSKPVRVRDGDDGRGAGCRCVMQ